MNVSRDSDNTFLFFFCVVSLLIHYYLIPTIDPRAKDIPQVLHRYHSLCPIEDDPSSTPSPLQTSAGGGVGPPTPRDRSKTFGYPTSLYKGCSYIDTSL